MKQLPGKEKEVARLSIDQENDVISFFREDSWPVSIVAVERSKALVIEKDTFESLDKTLQLYFFKNSTVSIWILSICCWKARSSLPIKRSSLPIK